MKAFTIRFNLLRSAGLRSARAYYFAAQWRVLDKGTRKLVRKWLAQGANVALCERLGL